NSKEQCDQGKGVGDTGLAVYLDFADAIKRLGKKAIDEKYGNLFQMYQMITDEDPYQVPMRIYPAIHYTMGGLWVDYNLMSTVPGCFVLGEANFSDHGANRLGASALMQGLADGYFVIPYTIGDYLATSKLQAVSTDHPAFAKDEQAIKGMVEKLLSIKGKKTVDEIHRELGKIMWEHVGMARNAKGLNEAITAIKTLREEFWKDVNVTGSAGDLNQTLERAGRVADFLEIGELIATDALHRNESCGGHFRQEYQTEENEARRDDENFTYVAAWEFNEVGKWTLNKEPLVFENVKLTQRSYK
ncbi:MAG TPA: FAD-binding protein, partial [Ignavibacteriales bacterium]|nr:FAD-binding protein [Ignavibacteriales bacterium]